MAIVPIVAGTDARFWARVDVGSLDRCWEWQWGRQKAGYGTIAIAGYDYGAHRIAYLLANGSIPAGLCVLHRCDNPPCCNPSHLFVGTKADNVTDMHAKGRGNVGSVNGQSKLNEEKVALIRSRVAAGEKQIHLSAEFGITSGTMSHLIARKTWRHVA